MQKVMTPALWLLAAIAGLLPTTASAVTQCVNSFPLRMCVQDSGRPSVVRFAPGFGQHDQYANGSDWGSAVWIDSQGFSTGWVTGNALTPVSNVTTGSGTRVDPHVITTVVDLGDTDVRLTQSFRYSDGDSYIRKSWRLENRGFSTYSTLKFYHGGDAALGGATHSGGFFDFQLGLAYTYHAATPELGLMGLRSVPGSQNHSHYSADSASTCRFTAGSGSNLMSFPDSNPATDSGLCMQWDRATLAPNEVWSLEMFEHHSRPGGLQIVGDMELEAVPGGLFAARFGAFNLTTDAVSLTPSPVFSGVDPEGAAQEALAIGPRGVERYFYPARNRNPAALGALVELTIDAGNGRVANEVVHVESRQDLHAVTPASVAFSPARAGGTYQQQITLTNPVGSRTVQVGPVGFHDALQAPFSILGDGCSHRSIAPGSSCVVVVQLAPTQPDQTSALDTLSVPIVYPRVVDHTIEVRANTIDVTHDVFASAGTGGSISPGYADVTHGQTAVFQVTASTGYDIDTVEGCNGVLVGTTYMTGTLNAGCFITATFSLRSYAVAVSADAGGTVTPPNATIFHGGSTAFSVQPLPGHHLVSASGCGGSLNGTTYTTGTITAACTVNVDFEINRYAVTASAGSNGSISPANVNVAHGSSTNFAVQPATGYHVAAIAGCGGSLNGNTYTTGPITNACAVSVSFVVNTYTVTSSAGSGGAITPASIGVDHGDTTAFTAQPSTGYHIDTVSGCGGSLNGTSYTTSAITSACAVNATFERNTYAVSTVAGTGGSLSPSNVTVPHGDSTTLSVQPATGYHVVSITGCGGTLNGTTYTTGAITAACAVSASFALNNYLITASANAGGTISPASVSVTHGNATTFTVQPDAERRLISVTGCGGALNGTSFRIDAITAACLVTARFGAITHALTATAGEGGRITPASVDVDHGTTTQLTITPDLGYSIASTAGCGGTLSGNIYTTAAVLDDCAVSVQFQGVVPGFDPAEPLPVELRASSLLTALPSNIAPTAVDYRGDALAVTLVAGQSRYAPGRHVLRWRAVDDRGNASTVEQVLRIWPTVSVGKDVILGSAAGTFGSLRIALNGVSPEYPFDVNYEVQGAIAGLDLVSGSVRFAAGEIEKDVFFALTDAASEQSVTVRLIGDINLGQRSSLTVSVVSRNEPGVVSFAGTQDGESRRVFGRDGGPVTLTAAIDDPNSTDTYTYQWRYPFQAQAVANGEQLVLQPASLSPGIHRIELSVTDRTRAPLVSTGVVDIVIRESTPALPAGVVAWDRNGLPSHPIYSPVARNVIPAVYGDTGSFLLEADVGVQLSLGAYASLRSNSGAQLLSVSEVGLREDAIANVGGYFDFIVSDLQRVGQSASVVLPQRVALPPHAMYRKWNSRHERWLPFVSDTANSLASAPGSEGNCPPPDSSTYRAGLNVGDWCVRLTLQDGGPNDDDRQKNGSISDPGGVVFFNHVTTSASRKGGGGSIDLWLLLLGMGLWLRARPGGLERSAPRSVCARAADAVERRCMK